MNPPADRIQQAPATFSRKLNPGDRDREEPPKPTKARGPPYDSLHSGIIGGSGEGMKRCGVSLMQTDLLSFHREFSIVVSLNTLRD